LSRTGDDEKGSSGLSLPRTPRRPVSARPGI
jgi:hypothetical protein